MRTACILLAVAMHASAAPPPLDVPHGQLQQATVMPNFLLNLSLTYQDAGAAYRGEYAAADEYQGYFNPRLCYSYPLVKPQGAPQQPDLDPSSGYFSPLKAADARHDCGADSFSGNLLNWATMSTFDLLRYGLTGGDRIVDEAGLTVLQRAWLPDGAPHADFYANPMHFPRKSVNAGAATPFGADTLYIVSCRNRVLFSATKKGRSCDAPRFGSGGRRLVSDKFFGEFNVSVAACGAGDMRPDLCHSYGRAFKPEGAMQASAARMRIGVMSYLTEYAAADPALYGGPLRTPLQQTGAEFDPDTGVAATPGSIDVVNRIGRSNPARPGAYKSGDPGAEMYYEALRYLQGRAPSAAAGGASDDGLPVANSRADPILAACQRNVIATVGHPAFAGDYQLPGNTRTVQGDRAREADAFAPARFDVMESARKVGRFEADPANNLGNPDPRPDLANLDTLDDGVGSYYLAAAAYWAHVNPIRPDKGIHVDSYALELGAPAKPRSSVLYLAAKYGAFDDRNADANPFIGSGEWSADGHTPTHFHAATEPQAVVDAVRALFGGALSRQAATGPSAAWRSAAGSFVIQSAAGPASLQRHALLIGNGEAGIEAKAAWDAATLLKDRPVEGRTIFTTGGAVTVPFMWERLPADLRAMLDGDHLGELRTAYLRGDRRRELGQPAGLFRKRDGVLGDIVHSVPLIVGAPSASIADEGHNAFREEARGRPLTVYVGADDGMLHAFGATDGAELFAFIPRALVAPLAASSDPGFKARAFADGSPGQGDALVGGRWKTVLVSGMGMGARGVFALDITDPAAFGQGGGALWEFTERDDPAIGHVQAAPQIVKINTNARGRTPVYRYFAIVPSGINNAAADGNGALFLLALDKPAAQRWKAGVNYYKIPTTGANRALANALSAPGLVTAADGSATYAYAGDLQGNLWRFDLEAKAAYRLFSAVDGSGRAQPISSAPRAVFAPGGGYLVLFGTGKLIEPADLLLPSFTPQSLYGILDRLEIPADPVSSRAQLAGRSLSGRDGYTTAGARIDYFAAAGKRGWYIDFANSGSDGERNVSTPSATGGAVLFTTVLPGADPCAKAATRLYVLDALSGLAIGADGAASPDAVTAREMQTDSLLPPLLIDTGLAISPRDATGQATASRSFSLIQSTAATTPGPSPPAATQGSKVKVSFSAMRMGWREVANWQELHEAAKK